MIVFCLKTWHIVEEVPFLPGQIYIQIFLSAPISLIIGVVLFFKYKHRITGILFFVLGLLWILAILQELKDGI
jgi:hypothetical protein